MVFSIIMVIYNRYEVLKDCVKEDNEDLYKMLNTRESVKAIDTKMDTAAKVSKKQPSSSSHRNIYRKEVFFSAKVTMVVKRNGKFYIQHGAVELL